MEDREWTIHRPHGRDFPEPVFIGQACLKEGSTARPFGSFRRRALVVFYPHAVCEIEDGDEDRWWDIQSVQLRRIPTLCAGRCLRPAVARG